MNFYTFTHINNINGVKLSPPTTFAALDMQMISILRQMIYYLIIYSSVYYDIYYIFIHPAKELV